MAKTKYRDYEVTELNETVEENDQAMSLAYEEMTEPETVNGTVCNSAFVNVRCEPSVLSESIGILNKGEKVEIFGKDQDFYKIRFRQGAIGYISSNFCKED